MALNDVTFINGQGGIGRALAGEDYIAGMAVYNNSLPSGFSSSARQRAFLSLTDAENAGIDLSYADETQATATHLITTAGAVGDTIAYTVTEPNIAGDGTAAPVAMPLGSYVVATGVTSIAAQGAAIAAAINTNTYVHGYTAAFATATLTITARKGLGVALNTGTPLSVSITGAFAGTLTQFTGGVASSRAIWHYHISEYFRQQPQGKLFFGVYAVPGTYTFTELLALQQFAAGAVRQFAVYKEAATTATQVATDVTSLQAVKLTMDAQHAETIILYAANIAAVTDLSTLPNHNNSTAYGVSAIIAQDGGFTGANLYLTTGRSITTIGACLGAVSLSTVNEDIAWAEKFNMTDGYELAVPAMANGQLVSALSGNMVSQLNSYRYLFLLKVTGVPGTYWNDNHCCVSLSSDYAYQNDNRVLNKARRLLYSALRPKVNAPLILKSDGTLTNTAIQVFIQAGEDAIIQNMVQGKGTPELSAIALTIDPAQNVLATSLVKISARIVADGVARNIQVNIGYVQSI